MRELFTGTAGQPLHPERYSGLFLIVLLLGLLYPLFTFWRTDIQDLDADEAVGEQNYADCFFIRHIARVILGLFVLVGCAYVLFEYLAYRQGERIKHELAEVADVKVRRLEQWRARHLDFALLSDAVPYRKNRVPAERGKNRRQKPDETQRRNPGGKRQAYATIPAAQAAASRKAGGRHHVELKFLDTGGVVSVTSADAADDAASAGSFIRRVLQNRRIAIGPMDGIKTQDGSGSPGFCLAVPVMDRSLPDKVKSILVFPVDPSRFLPPYMEALTLNRRGERTLLLQKEPSGFRVLGRRFDEVVTPEHAGEGKYGQSLIKAIMDGQTGFLAGLDAGGAAVVAHVVRIPDSDWFVAQQIDEKEIIRQIRFLAWLVLLAAVLFVALIGFLIFLWLRHRHLRYESEHLKLALRQQALTHHYDFLGKYANDIILLMDDGGNIMEANDRAEAAYGCTRLELIGRNIRRLLAPAMRAEFEGRWEQLKNEKSLIFETAHAQRGGTVFPVEISARVIEIEGERFIQCIIRDITEKKRSEEMIWQQANFDPVTKLANRRLFMEALHYEVRKAARANVPVALIFLDLDRFKDVNDTLGHAVGDLLLQQVAERLKVCVRQTDIVARLGGDEFTVILSGLVNFSNVKRVAENILRDIALPFVLDGNTVHVSSSVGITFFPEDADNVELLLKNADQAMYAAKKAGGNRYHYFTRSMQETAQARLHLTNDLHRALDNGEFEVVYQPVLTLLSGRISHAEALVRWHHPVRGMILPSEFIPLAEETGIIRELSDWIFAGAARQAGKWRAFLPDFSLGLNVSSVLFKNAGLDIPAWLDCLNGLALDPGAMVIEIAEGLLLELNDSIVRQLLALRDGGISLALDGFGTGYSSLSSLARLKIDYVKIDRTLTRNIVRDREARMLCEAMTAMAHKLGMRVIAEGVECREQADALQSMGCDCVQGFWVSEALGADACEQFLRSPPDRIGRPPLLP